MRGMRGEDVLGWQKFLMALRRQPLIGASFPAIRVDGIFGSETARATIAFQLRMSLSPDGIVGSGTWKAAAGAGLTATLSPGAPSSAEMVVPVVPIGPPPPPPPGPAPSTGSGRDQSWRRLRAEGWTGSGAVRTGLTGAGAVPQSVNGGTGNFVYDEYAVIVSAMPAKTTPEEFLLEMAKDLNGTVQDGDFDMINVFTRRSKSAPRVGEIIDIDIMGPENGSVVLVELAPTYFIFQTIECPETGAHPENGSREFGFQRNAGEIVFYTRGVSRPSNLVVGFFGENPQRQGWTSLMHGISTQLTKRGGTSRFVTFSSTKEKRPN